MSWKIELAEEFPHVTFGRQHLADMWLSVFEGDSYFGSVVVTWRPMELEEQIGRELTTVFPECSAAAVAAVRRWIDSGAEGHEVGTRYKIEGPAIDMAARLPFELNVKGAQLAQWSGFGFSELRALVLAALNDAVESLQDEGAALERARRDLQIGDDEYMRLMTRLEREGVIDAAMQSDGVGRAAAFVFRGITQSGRVEANARGEAVSSVGQQSVPSTRGRVFVSHAGAESDFGDLFVDRILKQLLGLRPDDIFYSSRPETAPAMGENWFEFIRDELRTASVTVVLLTEAYWLSPMSMLETGAALVHGDALYLRRSPAVERDVLGNLQIADASEPEQIMQLVVDLASRLGKRLNQVDANRVVNAFATEVSSQDD